jgi:hypothetical protein
VVGVDFLVPNFGGNTLLTHAVAFGRVDIVQWLRDLATEPKDDMMAAQLAVDFARWNADLSENERKVASNYWIFFKMIVGMQIPSVIIMMMMMMMMMTTSHRIV